jgi:hypothetical protein
MRVSARADLLAQQRGHERVLAHLEAELKTERQEQRGRNNGPAG